MFNSVFATTILGCTFRYSLCCLLCRDLLSVCNMVMCVDCTGNMLKVYLYE
jgi:hypothetical protein